MNHRALCVCCSGAKTATRCGRLYNNSRLAFGGWLLSQQICHASTALQSVGGEVEKDGKQAQNPSSVPETFPDVWQEEFQDLVNARPEEARNVFVEDLSATLEAHRAANRTSVVRRLNQKANWKTPWKTPKDFSSIGTVSWPTETAPTLPKDQNANTDSNAAEVLSGQYVLEPEDVALKRRKLKKSSRKGIGRDEKSVEKRSFRITRMDLSQRRLHWPADSVQTRQVTGERYHRDTSGPLEYEAMYIGPVGEFDTKRWRTRDYPWLARLGPYVPGGRNGSALQRLNDELMAYEKFMRLGPIEREAAEIFTADVTSLVQKVLPNSPVLPIGSYSTGLADRLSDFDFSISVPDLDKAPLERGPSSTRPKACKIRAKALLDTRISLAKSFQFIQPVEMIHARVPIVKAVHHITRFRVELQILGSHQATQEFTMAYLAEFPTLRPLYIVFRSALHIRRLNIVHEGGLGSYSILMMIVNALKHASGRFAQDDLASHFLYVLEFYSNADLYKYGFSPDPPRTIPKQAKLSADEKIARLRDPFLRGIDILLKANPKKPYLLCLQDPANPVNDLGSKAYGIKHVQKLFEAIRAELKINMAAWEGDGNFQKAWQPYALLAEFLGARYARLEEQRRQVEQWVKQRNEVYTIKEWRRLACPNEEPEALLEPSNYLDPTSERASDMAGVKAANGHLQVDMDEGLHGTGPNLGTVKLESGTYDEVTPKLDFEAETSTDNPFAQGQTSHRNSPPLTTSLPKGDATTQLKQGSTHIGSTMGDWKKWLPPAEDGLADTEEQPSDIKEHSIISALSQEKIDVQLPKGSFCSNTKTSSWKKWSPPTKDELTEQPPPSEPTPQSKADQVGPQAKADQDLKETSTHPGSPLSHLGPMAPRLSYRCQSIRRLSVLNRPVLHRRRQNPDEAKARRTLKDKANASRKRKFLAQPLTSGKSRDSTIVPPKWWSKHLHSPPDPRMWYDFPSELEELRIDIDFIKKIKGMEWSELANSLDRSRLKSIYSREGGDHALAITVLITHHARSALWRFQPKALKHRIRKRFGDGSLIPGFDNPRGQAAFSAAQASIIMPKTKEAGDIGQKEASIEGGLAATSRNETTKVNGPRDTILENDGGRPHMERFTHTTEAVVQSLALRRSGSIKNKVAKGSDVDEDRVERSETAGSGLPTGYEAPVPNLDYFNKREKALRTNPTHSAKSEKAVPRITKSNESAAYSEQTMSEQDNTLYSSYRRRRKKALLQVQAKQTQLGVSNVITPKSDYRDLPGGRYFRVFASEKAPHLRSEFRGSGVSTSTQETPMDASRTPEPRSDGGPAPEFWAKYEALDKLKKERGWGKYRDPHRVIEPLSEVQSQPSHMQALLMSAGCGPKDGDLTGTAKFFHKNLSGPPIQPKQIFVDNTPVIEKLNPEAHLSLEEQYHSSQRAAEDEWIQTLQSTGHITPPPSSSLPPKDSKKQPSKQAKRKALYRALARRTEGRRAAQLLQRAKKSAKLEKQREIQAKYTALREKLRKERRGELVGDRELKEGISEEKRGSVKWMEET